jgi:hypothetical protein
MRFVLPRRTGALVRDKTCVMDGAPFGALDREHTCIVCARAVCANHSTKGKMNPRTGEAGRACERCVSQTMDGDIETYVAHVFRELRRHQGDSVRPVGEAVAAVAGRAEEIVASTAAVSRSVREIAERQSKDSTTTQAALTLLSTQLGQLTASVGSLNQQWRASVVVHPHAPAPAAELRRERDGLSSSGAVPQQQARSAREDVATGRSLPAWWVVASALGWIVAALLAGALLFR